MMPLSIIVILLILALVFFRKKPSFSFKCLLTSTSLLVCLSIGWVADRVILPLENNYKSYTYTKTPIDYIVILGCGHTTDNSLPATSQLYTCSLERLVEAVRIYNMHPEAELITSGAAFNNSESNAEKVKQAAILLGVPAKKILVEGFPKDTEEEAELISPRVKGKRVVLVTNADHMLRAATYFNQQGVDVIAAPASKYAKGLDQEKSWGYYVPSSRNLSQSTTAWYEAIGLIVQWLKSL